MATKQDPQVQQKREVEKKQESTIPARQFLPVTDIFETDHALTLIMEMPGVSKDKVDVRVENDVLRSTAGSIFPTTRGCSRFILNTTSATMPGASSYPVRSIRAASTPS